jgi:hypothetical protein
MDHERQQNPLGWFKTSLCDLGKALKDIRRYISLTHDFKRALTVPGLLMVIPKICEGATVLTNVLKAMPHIFKGALMVFHPYLVLNESSDTIHGATSVVESDVLKGHGDTMIYNHALQVIQTPCLPLYYLTLKVLLIHMIS